MNLLEKAGDIVDTYSEKLIDPITLDKTTSDFKHVLDPLRALSEVQRFISYLGFARRLWKKIVDVCGQGSL